MVGKVLIINEISTFMGAETGTIKTLKILCISWLRTTTPYGKDARSGRARRKGAGHDTRGAAPNYLTTVSEGFSGRMRAAMM